jgi:hypothetical protein
VDVLDALRASEDELVARMATQLAKIDEAEVFCVFSPKMGWS